MKDTCVFCGGTIRQEIVTVAKEKKGDVVIIENVPAGVCSKCGEREYSPEIVEKFERIINQHIGVGRERTIPVADINMVYPTVV